ncbi:MAG: hypothetical protein ABI854_08600, partial [Betaproteobacteria bacterium]
MTQHVLLPLYCLPDLNDEDAKPRSSIGGFCHLPRAKSVRLRTKPPDGAGSSRWTVHIGARAQ